MAGHNDILDGPAPHDGIDGERGSSADLEADVGGAEFRFRRQRAAIARRCRSRPPSTLKHLRRYLPKTAP
jgi:hypothetical protein